MDGDEVVYIARNGPNRSMSTGYVLAERVLAWLAAARANGATVLIGDPGRSYFPRTGLIKRAEYQVVTTRELEDMEVKKTAVWAMP
eukprot:gene65136-89114_t